MHVARILSSTQSQLYGKFIGNIRLIMLAWICFYLFEFVCLPLLLFPSEVLSNVNRVF